MKYHNWTQIDIENAWFPIQKSYLQILGVAHLTDSLHMFTDISANIKITLPFTLWLFNIGMERSTHF